MGDERARPQLAPRVFGGNRVFRNSSREPAAKETVMTKLTDVVEATAIRPFQVSVPEAELTELAPAHQRDQVARTGTGRGCIARRAARDDAEARALLGDRLRLAEGGGEAQCPAAVHHRDRWAGHPLHSRSLETRRGVAAHRDARMARLDHRADEDHRSADQSHGARRKGIGRVRSGDSVDAGLRILGQDRPPPGGIVPTSRVPGSC